MTFRGGSFPFRGLDQGQSKAVGMFSTWRQMGVPFGSHPLEDSMNNYHQFVPGNQRNTPTVALITPFPRF